MIDLSGASSQDALVARALADFFMSVRHGREARQFMEAGAHPAIRAELSLLEAELGSADAETWPP
ncbi:MAG TPA: hypothetical protein VN837_06635 [Chloroflexota bacterium]|nr:hypothetical protein [Chloroflexota bacterium]